MSEQTSSQTELPASKELFSVNRLAALVGAFLRTLDAVSLILIWACVAVARALPQFVEDADISDPAVAIVSLPLFILVPRQLGVLLSPLAGKLVGSWQIRLNPVEKYVLAWLAGIWLIVVGLTILTGLLGVPSTPAAIVFLILATGSSAFFGLRSAANGARTNDTSYGAFLRQGWPLVVGLALVSVPLTIVRLSQPYPLQVGWGLFNYNYRILQFVESDHISIAPGLHTPIHAALLGVAHVATGAEPQGLIWAAPVLLYAAYGLGMYAFARRVLDNNLVALVATWVALWVLSISTFQHLHAVGMRGVILTIWPWVLLLLYRQMPALQRDLRETALHLFIPLGAIGSVIAIRWFLPSAFQVWGLLLLGSVLIAFVRSLPVELRQSVGLLTFLGSSLAFVHIIEGPLFFGLGLGFILVLSWKPNAVGFRVLLGGASAAIVTFIAVQISGNLTFDDPSMVSRFLLGSSRADAISLPFETKLDLFKDGLTYPILGLLALSATRLLFWPRSVHIAAIAAIASATFLYFFPETGLHRALGPVIPFIGLSIALESQWFAQRLVNLRWKQAAPLWSGALVIAAVIALTPSLTSSLRIEMGLRSELGLPRPETAREFSNTTPGEYEASVWITENIPQDWAIVSDPTTMFFMEGLTFHPQVARKRAWVAESEYSAEDLERLRSIAPLVFGAPTMQQALEGMESLTEEYPGAVLVISSRTLTWLSNPDNLFLLARPGKFLLERDPINSFCGYHEIDPCPTPFFESDVFSVVYNQDFVAVLVPSRQLKELDVQ